MLILAEIPGWLLGLMIVGFIIVCVMLVLTVLIQRSQGGGLAGAFGSAAGSGQTAFGAKTGDALTIFTISMFVVYVLAAVGLNYAVRPGVAPVEEPAAQSTPDQTNTGTPFPATGTAPQTPTPAPTPTDAPASSPQPAPEVTPGAPSPGSTPAPGAPESPSPEAEKPAEQPPAQPPAQPPTEPAQPQ